MSYIKHKLPNTQDQWLKNRLSGIGGSDAAAAIGKSPWVSPYTLWCEKRGLIKKDIDNESMRLGRDLENYVAERFSEATGKKVRKSSFSFQSVEYPFMLANVDRLIVGEDAGLECKTTSAFTRTKYDKGDIPIQYYIQCMHYMAVTGKKKWYIAVLVLGIDFYWFEVNWDDTEINNLIILEKEFWDCVENGVEPMIDGSLSTSETLNEIFSISDSSEVDLKNYEQDLQRLMEIKKFISKLDREKKQIENSIKNNMGKSEIGFVDRYTIKWKNLKQSRIDNKKLKKDYPEIYAKVIKEVISRRFEVTEENDNDNN